ncbi:hypothetical protein NP565_23435, partial [Vibrio parahaemolyticus]|nr:hypothetical protein [Vibrio parahaemolyticus]
TQLKHSQHQILTMHFTVALLSLSLSIFSAQAAAVPTDGVVLRTEDPTSHAHRYRLDDDEDASLEKRHRYWLDEDEE